MNRSAVRQIGMLAVGAIAALIVFVAFAAGQVVDVHQPRAGAAMGEIVVGRSIGQTFTSHRPNLDRLDLLLATYARTNPGQLDVQLSPSNGSESAQNVTVASSAIVDNAYQSFTFAPIASSAGRTYVVRLSSTRARVGQGVTAWAAPSNVYAEGTALVDGHPDPGRDLTFVTFGRLSAFDWLNELAQGISRDRGAVALAMLLLFLPGLALLGFFGNSLDLDVVSTLAIAPGLSIVAIALVYLWADLFRIPIVASGLWLLLVFSFPPAILALRRARAIAIRAEIGMIVFVGLVTATELAIVNRVDVPFWGDSYQHTLIVRLLLDHHGLITNWQPYTDLQSFTYHFGFHGYAAALATLAELSAPEAVIVAAQILAAAAAVASVALARAFGARAFGSLIVLVVVAFFSPMPSYFVNWGRDTQLAGLVVLGSVGALWMVGFRTGTESKRPTVPVMTLLAIGVAGLGLTHYREVLIWGVFVVAWWVVIGGKSGLRWARLSSHPESSEGSAARSDGPSNETPADWQGQWPIRWRPRGCNRSFAPLRITKVMSFAWVWDDSSRPVTHNSSLRNDHRLVPMVWSTAGIHVAALLLAGPWLPRLLEFAQNARQIAAPPSAWSAAYNAFGDFGFFVPWSLLALALTGLALRSFRGQTAALILVLWVVGCFAVANLPLLGGPAGALLNNFSIEIGLFLPVSIAVGLLADDLFFLLGVWIEEGEKKSVSTLGESTRGGLEAPPSRRHPQCSSIFSSATRLLLGPRLQSGWIHAIVLGVVVGLACVGSTHQLGILDRNQALVLDADRPALSWIQTHTPTGSRFLVNSFLGMGGTVAVGSDAGWWLPILANRPTTLPPVNYTDERMAPPQRTLVRQLASFPPDRWGTAAGLNLLRQAGIAYVFLGAAGGRLSPADFDGQPAFQVLYESGPTRVYRVVDERKE